jgi:hypothetical protein
MGIRRPTPAEMGLEVTIAIAAISMDGRIVTVSDRMISYDDIIQAEDDGVLKAQQLAPGWGTMFAGSDARLFIPVWNAITDRITSIAVDTEPGRVPQYTEAQISEAVAKGYQDLFAKEFATRYLTKWGFNSVEEFRKDGFSQLGKDVFGDLSIELSRFDLGLQLICHGHDTKGNPRIFEVENPGRIHDCDLFGYAVIGSGYWMASASLRRKPLERSMDSLTYRLLDAKFSAETASGVGRTTSVLAFNSKNEFSAMPRSEIESLRKIWEDERKKPEPNEALEIIKKSRLIKRIGNG